MVYNIELSFDILKVNNISYYLDEINKIAKNNDCKYYYNDCEIENNKYSKRNHYILNYEFHTSLNIILFIKYIKNIKNLYIEVIYKNDKKIIYASSFYINKLMNKEFAKKYNEYKNNLLNEDEIDIINELKK